MLYFFYGDNTFAAKRQIQQLLQRYRASTDNPEFGLHRFDKDADPRTVITALTSQPMFAESSLVIIENPSQNKALQEVVAANLERIPSSTVAIIYEAQVDKRTNWFKRLTAEAKTTEFTPKSEAQLLQWIKKEAQVLDLQLDGGVARFLLDWVGPDQWRLSRELEKLAASGEVSEATIRDVILPSPRHSIFELLDVLATGNTQAALAYYDDLRSQNVHELEILTMLGWQLRNFLIIASAEGASDQQIAKDFRINPYVIRKSKPLAHKIPLPSLTRAYQYVIAADYAIKTGGSVDDTTVLEKTIVDIGHIYAR